ncbi:hypothetical protein KFL_004890090 [Klebsormidium nitens]|uniref:Maf-like protein n=1 Tax=Klebsormidium nitens TaxID=105231 RepID=A0A1Y1IK44_KLENI|nr:hypothetical protein KFL_004890090 [Klebsormidium nitens]|eukprot:GAQ89126.1 hypothetical protein KFL_004890090 [Klebsormidium nitens]
MVLQHIAKLNSQKRIILGSQSPRRKELLQGLGLTIQCIASTFEEQLDKSSFKTAALYAIETATHKAIEVALRCASEGGAQPDLVIGADTVVEHGGVILEKPRDAAQAKEFLTRLSGEWHSVHTGVVLLLPKVQDPAGGSGPLVRTFSETTQVEFAPLQEATIDAYVATGDSLDKAGAYGIQSLGGCLVRRLQGDYFTVMGFPLCRFSEELTRSFLLG